MKYMRNQVVFAACALSAVVAWAAADYPVRGLEPTAVRVTGGFWFDRFETNRLVTVRDDFAKCEETRIPNFTNAAKRLVGTFKGIPFDDSDVYKVIEGAAYTLAQHPDPKLEKYCDDLIAQIAAAQEPDGYLYTARTLGFPVLNQLKGGSFSMCGPTRWSNCQSSHELYNVGHMYEAAVAYRRATGKDALLNVARKSADLVCRTFGYGENQLRIGPGHQEIELALCKLYRETGDEKYLRQAKFFLDVRGREWTAGGQQIQAHKPVLEQEEPIGHSVRAGYMYSGMADIAALTGDAGYVERTKALWDEIVGSRLYLHGGVGRQCTGEGYSLPYDLPNDFCYAETCASIANALFSERLFRTYGEAKYMDVFELIAYNGFLAGVALTGDHFFYPNPMASAGGYARKAWFGCSCCPVNIVRFIPQLPSFAYATRGNDLYWNLFLASEGEATLPGGTVKLVQKTDYPWSGEVALEVRPAATGQRFALKVRIPGWARGAVVPSALYAQTEPDSLSATKLAVNGEPVALQLEKGYATIERAWKPGDRVTLSLPFGVKRVKADWRVRQDRGRLAVMRGPVLYCAEGVDNGGHAKDLRLAATAAFASATVDVNGAAFPALVAGAAKLVPYCVWANRGGGELETWFPTAEPELWGHLVPLATVTPDFSIYGYANSLTEASSIVSYRNSEAKPELDVTPVSVVVSFADGRRYRVLGAEPADVPALQPVAGEVRALSTEYRFAADGHAFALTFFQPFFGDDLDALSRPVTYVSLTSAEPLTVSATVGKSFQNEVLGLRATVPKAVGGETVFLLTAAKEPEAEFLGKATPSWWARNGKTHAQMIADAEAAYPALKAKGAAFERDFRALTEKTGGVRYRQVCEWVYRQSYAACRLFRGPDGQPFYYPRENGSGEMIGTVDVIYPQFPHLLLYAPKLAKAILEPVMTYAASGQWPYPYAPHDLGRWPRANGQYYGMKKGQAVGGDYDDSSRMPVEECGNMLLMLAAVSAQDGDAAFASRWWPMVTKWAEYLERFGFDPGNQLCTDDFAGHLAHNANLSLKSIMAFAAYARMAELRGESAAAAKYAALARACVPKWLEAAKGGADGAYCLAFDKKGTWAQKYNLAWDRYLGFNLFPSEVAERELACYRKKMEKFGLPLDNRGRGGSLYTKSDWTLWCGVLTGRRDDIAFLSTGVWNYINTTTDRRPVSDWHYTGNPKTCGFFARSVMGGVLFPALDAAKPAPDAAK